MPEKNCKYLSLHRDGRVLTVHFDAGKKVNSLSNALMRELSAIVLTGRKDMFTGGMDLKDTELAAAKDSTVA